MLLAKMHATDGSGARYALKWQGVHEATLKPVLRDTEIKAADGEGDDDVIAEARSRTATRGLSFARFPNGGLRCGRRGETRILGVFVEAYDAPDGGTFKFAEGDAKTPIAPAETASVVEKPWTAPTSVDAWREIIAALSPESTYALIDAIRLHPSNVIETPDAARPDEGEKAASKPAPVKSASAKPATGKTSAQKPATGKGATSKGKAR